MNTIRKSLCAAAAVLFAFAGLADWGEVTIGKVTFEYYYSDGDECEGCREYCGIQHLAFDDEFSGALTVPATLDGHAVTGFYPDEYEEGEFDVVTSIKFPAGLDYIGSWCVRDFRNIESVTVDSKDTRYTTIDGVLYRFYEWFDSAGVSQKAMTLAVYPAGKKTEVYEVPQNACYFYADSYRDWVVDYDDEGNYTGDHLERTPVNTHLKTLKFPAPTSENLWLHAIADEDAFPNLKTAYLPIDVFFARSHADSCIIFLPGVETLHVTGNGSMEYALSKYCCLPDLRTLVFDGKVTEVPENAFGHCTSLESVTLPTGLVRIGAKAFCGCTNLTSMTIPSTVKYTGKFAFAGCPAVDSDADDVASALDLSGVTATTAGAKPWTVDFDEFVDGGASMRSGAIGDGQHADLSLTAKAAGEMSFWWKVSSEAGYDELKLLVNDEAVASVPAVSGTASNAWTRVALTVKKGDVVTWRYEKDVSGEDGDDAGWVDLVKMPDAAIETDVADVFQQFGMGEYFDKSEVTRLLNRLDKEITTSPKDYKLRLYRALATVLNAVTDQRLQDLFETCGYELDISDLFKFKDLKAEGVLSFDNLPKTDAAVDTVANVLLPALKSALTDLNVIPESWSGTVALDANLLPCLSETVYVDKGDVLLAKAGVESALGAIEYLQAQQFNLNYAKLPVVLKNQWTENFPEGCATYESDLVPMTKASVDGRNVIRESAAAIAIDGKSGDWSGIKKVARLTARQLTYQESYPYYTQTTPTADWMKIVRNGDKLSIAVKSTAITAKTPRDNFGVYIQTPDGSFVGVCIYDEDLTGFGSFAETVAGWYWTMPSAENGWSMDDSYDFDVLLEGAVSGGFTEIKMQSSVFADLPVDSRIELWLSGEGASDMFSVLDFRADPSQLEPSANQLMADHPEFLAKIRSTAKLTSSKAHVTEAMRLFLAADAVIEARTDSLMHFFEYNPTDADHRAEVRSYVKQVQPSLKSAQTFDLTDTKFGEKVKVFAGGFFDTKGLTRSLLPTITADNKVVLSSAPDYTLNGILPNANLASWQRWMASAGAESRISDGTEPQPVVIAFDGNGAEDYETETREYEAGETYGDFPEVYRDEEMYTFLGWYTAKTGGEMLSEDTTVPSSSTTVYARWEKLEPHVLTVVNGFAFDEEDNPVSSLSLMPDARLAVEFDYGKICNASGEQEIGAFQKWTVSPADADLGEDFDPTDPYPTVVMPNAAVTLTANYIPVVAATLRYNCVLQGDVAESCSFYWSVDGGKTLVPFDGETESPVAAGTQTVTFHAIDDETGKASGAWVAPAAKSVRASAPATYVEEGVTYYDAPEQVQDTVWFLAKDGAMSVAFDANGGSVAPSSMHFIDGCEYYELPEPTRKGYVFDGWWTSLTDGELVAEGDFADFSLLDAKKPTLYAHWLKAYTLTIKPSPDWVRGFTIGDATCDQGDELPFSVSFLEGDEVWIWATESAEKGEDDGDPYDFTGWTGSKGFDLGDQFDQSANETSVIMPAADVTLTANYRQRYLPIAVTVTGGFTTDREGETVSAATLFAGESAPLVFDYDKLVDAKSGETVGAFQRWTWEPATVTAEELGEDFDMFSLETSFIVPDVSGTKAGTFKLTAQYVSPVAGYVTYEFASEGQAEEEAAFYWSPDSGKTQIPSGQGYPLAAGTIKALAFYAKDYEGETSAYWRAPTSVSLTIPKRGTYKESGVTYYEEPTYIEETEWFVAADGAQQIAFNANGGKCAVASRWYLDGEMGGTYYTLPTPAARSGYVFDGWQTTKTGGEKVTVGDSVDFSRLDTKKPTLYARWLKAYTLTLKGTDVEAVYLDEEYTKSVSVLQDGIVALRAPDGYEDVKGSVYLFQCWTPSKAYDFGDEYAAGSCETTIVMPAANVTMTAKYIKESEAAWLTMYATGTEESCCQEPIEADPSQFYWSTDGKSWFRSGTTALVKKGKCTIQWKSASSVWKAPTAKTTVTVAAGDEYSNEEDPAVFTFIYTASVAAVVYENGDWYESTEGGTATMNPADGRLVSGKSITFTAKSNKNYVFAGWQPEKYWDDYGFSPYTTSEKYTTSYLPTDCMDEEDYKVHFQAVFRPISDYTEEDLYNAFPCIYSGCSSFESSYDDDPLAGTVELQAAVGCLCEFSFEPGSSLALPLTYTLTGKLPVGLKFATADRGQQCLTGTPTTTGATTFTLTATDPAGHAATLAVTVNVRAVDVGIAGDYRALMTDAETGAIAGLLEMSVTSAGKASAKITTVAGGTVSLTPTLSWCPDSEDPDGKGTFSVNWYKKSGNETSGSYVSFCASFGGAEGESGFVSYDTGAWKNGESVSSAYMSGDLACADQSWLSDPDFADAFLGKYYTVQLSAGEGDGADGYRTPTELMAPGYLTITTDKKGAVKVAGKLADGNKVSASTVLLPSADGSSASAILMVVPSGYKKKGCVALQLDFSSDGYVSSSLGTWITPPLLDAISGCEYCSDDERFLSGKLALSANGAFYSALSDLTDYYMSLYVTTGEVAPMLEYTYTEEKQKMYGYAESVFSEFGLDGEMLTGGKSGKITVAKSGTPWKQSDGTYNYEETKKGEEITNPAGLTIAFKPATGIFSGSFKLYFDYETTKMEHKEVKCTYEGVLINDGSQAYGAGSAVYAGKYTYQYETSAGKAATKTYTQKYALPVSWSLE